MRYVLTGGGTGGHVHPALAIKDILKQHNPAAEFLYIGAAGKAEEYIFRSLSPQDTIPVHYVQARGLPRTKNIVKLFPFFKDLLSGTYASMKVLQRYSPNVIIATGGYVSAPVIFAGYVKRKKIVIHEQNSVPGLVTTVMSRFADKVLVTFPETVDYFPPGKAKFVGYPVRRNIIRYDKTAVRERLGIHSGVYVVFIFGGSSGAQLINECVVNSIGTMLQNEGVVVVHGTGRDIPGGLRLYSDTVEAVNVLYSNAAFRERYIIRDYIQDIDAVYSAADVVMSRAGAGTIMECAALGIPMILIPKSGLPGDHQTKNAESVEKIGGGIIIPEVKRSGIKTIDGELVIKTVTALLHDTHRLSEMSANIQKLYNHNCKELILQEITSLFKN